MKDTIKWFGIIAMVAVMGILVMGCGDNGDPESTSGSIPSVLVGSWGDGALVINADGSGTYSGNACTWSVSGDRLTLTIDQGGVTVSGSVKYEITADGKLKVSDAQDENSNGMGAALWTSLVMMSNMGGGLEKDGEPVPEELGDNATYEQALAALDAIIAHPDTPAKTKKAAQDLKKEITKAGKSKWGSGSADFINSINDLIDEIGSGSGAPNVQLFIVRFVDGDETIDTQRVPEGKWPTPPDVKNRDGYEFDGWYKEEACINRWNFDGSSFDRVTSDITLYAKWIAMGAPIPDPEG